MGNQQFGEHGLTQKYVEIRASYRYWTEHWTEKDYGNVAYAAPVMGVLARQNSPYQRARISNARGVASVLR